MVFMAKHVQEVLLFWKESIIVLCHFWVDDSSKGTLLETPHYHKILSLFTTISHKTDKMWLIIKTYHLKIRVPYLKFDILIEVQSHTLRSIQLQTRLIIQICLLYVMTSFSRFKITILNLVKIWIRLWPLMGFVSFYVTVQTYLKVKETSYCDPDWYWQMMYISGFKFTSINGYPYDWNDWGIL